MMKTIYQVKKVNKMKKNLLLIIMVFITFSACKTVSSSDETVTTEEADTEIAVSVASDSVVSKETVSPKTDDTTVSVKPSRSKKENEEPTSYVEVYPDTSELPTEIMQVFYEDKPFKYVFKIFKIDDDSEITPRGTIETTVKDFVYDVFFDETEDGNLSWLEWNTKWKEYTVIDLDDDGVNELVYLVDPGSGGFYIIFHVIDGEVYGYSELYRFIGFLYKDRTFVSESGAGWYNFRRITSFNKEGYTIEELARAEQPHAEQLYYIGDEEVDEATFRDYTAQWGDKYCEMAVKWISADSE
jgi:hypothetical protein